MIDLSKKSVIETNFTKYEIARILGARALQIAMNAPILLKLDKKDLESINHDPLKIAEAELYAGILPITVKRPLPQRGEDKLPKAKVEKKEEKKEEKIEEKQPAKTEETAQAKEDAEKKEEETIIKEVEGTEIMEMANPEDEEEISSEPEAEGGEE